MLKSFGRFLPNRDDALIRVIVLATIINVSSCALNKVHPNNFPQADPQQEQWYGQQKETPWDDPIVILNGLLVIATGFLAYFTINLANSTRVSADAAKQAADAALLAERSAIIEVIRKSDVDHAFWASLYDNSPTMSASLTTLQSYIGLKNYGKTPGTVLDFSLDFRIERSVPQIIDPPVGESVINERTIPYGEEREVVAQKTIEITWADSRSICLGTANIYILGRIVFDDVFENTWTREFVWEYHRDIKGWVQVIGHTRKSRLPKQEIA